MPFRIYYLDDEPDLLEVFKDSFSSDEILITLFSDPAAAIEAIAKNPPDLVFLDYRLPKTTGDQIALGLNKNIPKALISGDLQVVTQARFDAIFTKPFKNNDIEAFINSVRSQKT